MTATATPPAHRVTRAVTGAREQLGQVTDVPVWSLDPEETAATLTDLQALAAQVAELQSRVLRHAEVIDLPGRTGATSVPNWLAHHTRLTRRETRRQTRLATALEKREPTRAALADGRVHVEQAEVIVHAVDQLPDDLDAQVVADAEAHLIEQAAHFDATQLKTLGRRILEVIDPEAADAHEATLLEKEERDAQAATRLTMWEDGHGKVHGKFTLDAVTGAMLKKALLAFAAPKHRASQGPLGERRPTPERLGRAFTELIQRYPVKQLPKAGGLNATVVVLMPLDTLLGGLKAANSTPARPSAPPSHESSPVRPGSSPPSSAVSPRSSTSAARSASTPRLSGSWPPSNRAAARSRAATTHPG